MADALRVKGRTSLQPARHFRLQATTLLYSKNNITSAQFERHHGYLKNGGRLGIAKQMLGPVRNGAISAGFGRSQQRRVVAIQDMQQEPGCRISLVGIKPLDDGNEPDLWSSRVLMLFSSPRGTSRTGPEPIGTLRRSHGRCYDHLAEVICSDRQNRASPSTR